jgi:hypothetical protein
MAKAKPSRIRIIASQSKLLPLRRRRIRRMRVVSCAQTAKEENLNLSRKL